MKKPFVQTAVREQAHLRQVNRVLILTVGLFGADIALDASRPPLRPAFAAAPEQKAVEEKIDSAYRAIYAKQSIPAGTKLEYEHLEARELPKELSTPLMVSAEDIDSLIGKAIRTPVDAGTPLYRGELIEVEGETSFHIPAGYRAVSIFVDPRTSVEGYAHPGSLVDVLLTMEPAPGKKEIITVARMVKVVSVQGATTAAQGAPSRGMFPMTLLAPEREAKAIHLALATGQLSLALVGKEESFSPSPQERSMGLEEVVARRVPHRDPIIQVSCDRKEFESRL